MATDLDELQIVITSNSNEASEALDKLVTGLENLNTTLSHLDTSKITSFSNAMSKLAGIGANTDTTGKAVKSLANDLASSFGIKTKKGIEDITIAMLALYKASRNVDLNGSMENTNIFENNIKNLRDAIEANYQYRESVDETNKKIADFVKAQNKSGSKVAMGEMAEELGEDFKAVSKILGSSFKNTLKDNEAIPLAEFLTEMNEVINTDFKTDTLADLQESIERIKNAILDSKPAVYDYGEAISKGLLTGEEAGKAALDVVDKLFTLIKEQDKYGASAGLSGLVAAMQTISNANIPDMSGFAEVAKFAQNISTNASKVAPEINDIAKAMDNVAASAEKATESVNKLNTSFILISNRTDLAVLDPAKLEKSLAVLNDISKFQPPDFSTNLESFNEYAYEYKRKIGKVLRLENNQKLLEDKYFSPIDTTGEWVEPDTSKLNTALKLYSEVKKAAQETGEATKEMAGDSFGKLTSMIEEALKAIKRYKAVISGMENGTIKFDQGTYDAAVKGLYHAQKAVESYKKSLIGLNKEQEKAQSSKGTTEAFADVGELFERMAHGLEKASEKFGSIADKGIGVFKKLGVPIKAASSEYIEKFEKMGKAVENFQKDFNVHMKKVSDFWKRTMRTFTFMIVRKVFTAVIKEVGTAVQSLALYSNAMGGAFNTDISNMVADFQYLGRSIVSVFAPLLSYIAPVIDAIVSKIATLLSYVGMLIAALGGATSFTKAKKNVNNYAESLDKASKSAKNLTMGIDELNILNDSKSGSAKPYDGWEDAWEDVKIPDWIKKLSDKLKGIFKDLFDPIKRAWDKAKDYVLSGWKFMTKNMKQLLADVWRDFIRVWKSDTVEHIFYNLFLIIGDIERVIGFIAKRFDEAWNEGEKGYKILSNIADIVDIIVQHLRNVTSYMIGWAASLNFNPLLESFETLTKAFADLADFAGNVFEDVMKNVVLRYIKFLIEKGIPHLQETIAEVIDAFDFDDLRQKLQPLEEAFERLLEHLDEGKTNAIGNLGKQIAEFTKSEDFENFLKTIEHMMDIIDAELVEKILTGIGTGIGRIADALIKFVGSEFFNAFLDDIKSWFDSVSAEDIADALEKIAIAIAMFKFAEFASSGMSKFFAFAETLKSFTDVSAISGGLESIGKSLGLIGSKGAAAGEGGLLAAKGLTEVSISGGTVVAIIALVIAAVYSLIKSFGGLSGLLMELRNRFIFLKEVAERFAHAIQLDASIQKLKDAFHQLGEKLGNLKDFWDVLLDVVNFVGSAFIMLVETCIKPLIDQCTLLIHIVGKAIDVLGGLGTVLKSIGDGIVTGDWSTAFEGIKEGATRAKDAFIKAVVIDPEEIAGMIKPGIEGGFSDASQSSIESVSNSAKQVTGAFEDSIYDSESELKGAQLDTYSNALNSVGELDFTSPANTYAQMNFNAYESAMKGVDYKSLGALWNEQTGGAVLSNNQIFKDSNRIAANEGAAAFSQAYLDFHKSNSGAINSLKSVGGKYGQGLVDGLNSKIDELIPTTQTSINAWFTAIDKSIHDNPSMPYGSPNVKAMEYGKFIVEGFNEGITKHAATSADPINEWMKSVSDTIKEAMLKWDAEIFTPLENNIYSHWNAFVSWWEESMTDWWNNHVVTWFGTDKWNELFTPIVSIAEEVFQGVTDVITLQMENSLTAVQKAVEEMKKSFSELLSSIKEMEDSLDDIEGPSKNKKLDLGSPKKYATGGFPQAGTLFYAGEAGAEFVSNVNGRTGVVSNDEITGIADAVYSTGNTESALLSQLIAVGQALLNKDPVILGDKDLAMAVNRGKSQMGMSIIT